jgi:hypothetical protein
MGHGFFHDHIDMEDWAFVSLFHFQPGTAGYPSFFSIWHLILLNTTFTQPSMSLSSTHSRILTEMGFFVRSLCNSLACSLLHTRTKQASLGSVHYPKHSAPGAYFIQKGKILVPLSSSLPTGLRFWNFFHF